MPKKAAGLTARTVATAKAPGLFADGGGLYLQVTTSGARSWIFRFAMGGRRRDMGLGSAVDVSLADAREKAGEARKLVAQGVDPIEARRAAERAAAADAAKVRTFKQCAEAFIKSKQAGWRNAKHGAQWSATLEAYAYPKLGALPVSAVDTGLVLEVLEPIWTTKSETAARVRGRIEAILDYARVRGYRSGENPARWKGHLDHILPARSTVARVKHHAALPYSALPAFWPKLQALDGFGARALQLAILTACRSGEVLGCTWQEFDLDAAVWTIPAERMKAGLEHRVPLSAPALALLRKLAAVRIVGNDHVFPGQAEGRGLSNMALAMVLRRMNVDVTPHGFRSTFRTWVAERTAYPHDVAEAALAHTIENKVVAAYQRGDLFEKRRRLMGAWATYCMSKPTAGGKVVAMKSASLG